jgi:DNA-binding response OmpR family regulator
MIQIWARCCKKGKCEVVLCKDGDEGLKEFTKSDFDLLILDVMMPKKDGFTLGKEIRKMNQQVPIIFATAKAMIDDKTQAFNLGGDDYITKPFRIEELLLRINALLKRTVTTGAKEEEKPTKFKIGKYDFDFMAQVISSDAGQQKLSTKEAALLRLLCLHTNECSLGKKHF